MKNGNLKMYLLETSEMASQIIWVGIVIAVFFIGIGASYVHFASTYDPMSMKFQNQEFFN